jgi:7-cyano-7-deazaguanine reductase
MPTTDLSGIKSLGTRVTEFQGFETFPSPIGVHKVKLVCDELTGICPITSQPDLYTVTVIYQPDRLCVESKTVKLYFQKYRNQGIFCESLSDQIAQDFITALNPRSIEVILEQKPRGGVAITSYVYLTETDKHD